MTPVFLFPGQSSRTPNMIVAGRRLGDWAEDLVQRASALVGRDLSAHYQPDNPNAFARNQDIQVGVFLATHLHLTALTRAGVTAQHSLGLSLGEYNHLVHIGALTFEAALQLVDARGAAYDLGPFGMMVSVSPVSVEELEPLCAQVRHLGVVEIGNLNSPTQQVLSGERAAVEAAARLCESELYAQTTVIEERIPMHCSVFRPAADRLRPALKRAPWATPNLAYLPNVDAVPHPSPTTADFVATLERHVYSPVRWRESIDWVVRNVESPQFIEVGPRAVLFNLLQKNWVTRPKLKTDDRDDLAASLAHVAHEVRADGR